MPQDLLTGAPPPPAADPVGWAEVRARWDDEAAHRAFLDRHRDLDGLAAAGRCYRAVLERSPADPVAARWRDEVVKRATLIGIAQLPRSAPPRKVLSPGLRRWLALAAGGWLVLALLWALGLFR